jgi:iron complex outermembrane receptor protein
MNKRKFKLASSTAIIAFAALQALPMAVAQTSPAAEEDDRRDVVVVTASRREENVQDIPLNIAAVGDAQIEAQGFDELADVLAYVPGINVVDRGGRQGNPIIVRGLNADGLGSGDGNNDGGGTVATYLGEVPVFLDLKLNDLERVEVLLGPQGTLYGAGTLGGAIRYIPKKPDFDGDTLDVRTEISQYSEAEDLSYEAGLTFNKAFAPNFAIRGSIDYEKDSGFTDYPFVVRQIPASPTPIQTSATRPPSQPIPYRSVEDADSEEILVGPHRRTLGADWNGWMARSPITIQDADIEGRTPHQPASAAYSPTSASTNNTKRVLEPNKIKNELLALEVTADLGFAELTSATGYSAGTTDDGQRDQTDLLISLEYSYEAFPTFTAYTHELGEEEARHQRGRSASSRQTEGPLSWIVGAFYNESEVGRVFG